MSSDGSSDGIEDTVDPRVQVELEKLNTATDEINNIEVSLDECRSSLRLLLAECNQKIEESSKKLGKCVSSARPYYDARLKAREALRDVLKSAAKFEKACLSLASAKEMVSLAEKEFRTEGRTFDHMWQEMLNHATMKVYESEALKTDSEVEHKRSLQLYQTADARVQTLQKSLKKTITKSRPYYELKIHYYQLLEEKRLKLNNYMRQVADVKTCYAETLRNLEQISEEIHQTREVKKLLKRAKTVEDSFIRHLPFHKSRASISDSSDSDTPCAANASDALSEYSEPNKSDSVDRYSVFSLSGPDAFYFGIESEPEAKDDSDVTDTDVPSSPSQRSVHSPVNEDAVSQASTVENQEIPADLDYFQGVGICSFPITCNKPYYPPFFPSASDVPESEWTEIPLTSPTDELFPTVHLRAFQHDEAEDDIDVMPEPENPQQEENNNTESFTNVLSFRNWIANRKKTGTDKNDVEPQPGPSKIGIMRRSSLDVLMNAASGEKVKEMLSQSIMKLHIKDPRRGSESVEGNDDEVQDEQPTEESKSASESTSSTPLKLPFFSKKKAVDEKKPGTETPEKTSPFKAKNDILIDKKVLSPLEKTLSIVTTDDDSSPESESFKSVDKITDGQLYALLMDDDLTDLYKDYL